MKKIILVFVNQGMAELDWILPVLNRLSNNYTIFTYFRSQKSYNALMNNAVLYELWKNTNSFFYIEKYFHRLLFKILKKINGFFKFNDIEIYLNNKIQDVKIIENIINKNIYKNKYQLKIIFSDYGEHFLYLEKFKKKKKERPLIVHYPHSPVGRQKNTGVQSKVKLSGDLLLLGRKEDIFFFSNAINKKKIKPVGIPRFDKYWIDKNFLKNNNGFDLGESLRELKKRFVITIAYDSKYESKRLNNNFDKLFDTQLEEIMSVILKIPNALIIFKLHPRRNSEKFQKILNKYDQNIWKVSKMHLMQLANLSDCFLSAPGSGAGYEALNFKVPSIQYWPITGASVKKDINIKLGFIKQVKNKNELLKFINLSKDKKNQLWKSQQKNFRSNYSNLGNSSLKVIKVIKEAQKILNNQKELR